MSGEAEELTDAIWLEYHPLWEAYQSLISWCEKARNTEPASCIHLSCNLENPEQLEQDGWSCSHGECPWHLNSGSSMRETTLPPSVLQPPVNPKCYPNAFPSSLSSDPWALPRQRPTIALIFEEKRSLLFPSFLTERWHRYQPLCFPNYRALPMSNIILIGQWGLLGLPRKERRPVGE